MFLFVNKTHGGQRPNPLWMLIHNGSPVLYFFDGLHRSERFRGWETGGVLYKTPSDKVY